MDKQQFSKFTECLDNFLAWIDEKGYNDNIVDNMIREYQEEKSKYVVRNREVGDIIQDNLSLLEAQKLLATYETKDREDDIFVENFYEVAKQD